MGAQADDTGTRQFVAVLLSAVLGILGGDKSVTVARHLLRPASGEALPDGAAIAALALIVIFVVAALAVVLGALTVQRQPARLGEVSLAVCVAACVALVVAFLTIAEYSLPPVPADANPNPGPLVYFLLWAILLCIAPIALLPNSGRSLQNLTRCGLGLLVVVTPMAAGGLLIGAVLDVILRIVGSVVLPGDEFFWDDATRFWIAAPPGVNAICGAYVPVAFAGLWWRELGWSKRDTWSWGLRFTLVAAFWSGLFGFFFYESSASPWRSAVGFGALPLAVSCAVSLTYGLTRRDDSAPPVGWAVSDRFRPLLGVVFATTFALTALVGLAPLNGDEGMRRVVLVAAHGLNGFAMGAALGAVSHLFRLIPASRP